MSHHFDHDLECGSAAYALLIERAEKMGDRNLAKELRGEWRKWRERQLSLIKNEYRMMAILHEERQESSHT